MKRLSVSVLCLFFLSANTWADPDKETFESCASGFPSQDCLHINEADERFSVLEGEQAVQNDRLDALEEALGSVDSGPRWALGEYDESFNFIEDSGLRINQFPFNTNGRVGSVFMQVVRLNGSTGWMVGAYSQVNGRVTPTWQGVDGATYQVLAFAPGTGCSGEPIAMFTRTQPGAPDGPSISELFSPVTAAYDPRTGRIYRSGGGNDYEHNLYDIYEYGYDKGWLPHASYGCTQNVDIGAHPNFELQDGNGPREVLKFPNPFYWADSPYFDPNYERHIGLAIVQ